ncbi:MAG TPA: hypothetical protein VNO30_32145 [Kofleriaceae bacterium]|nr:hypothetical protein [Kofleriaceae bacterium]
MRQRWEWLVACSVVSLVGIGWLLARIGAPADAWPAIEIAGMVLCAVVAIAAHLRGAAKKWPAAVALACALPMAQNLVLSFPLTMELMLRSGVPYLLFLVGAVGAVAAAIAILVARPPLEASDQIVAKAPARR